MKYEVKKHPRFGESLYADNGTIEIIIPLEYGIRIGHFSFCGGENVFFEQPEDMADLTTPDGWRVHCGHRLWLAPEGEHDYHPDNEPISFEIIENDKILLTQKKDPRLSVRKRMLISFGSEENGDEARLTVMHRVENVGEDEINMALWAISAMAAGGIEHIPMKKYSDGFFPRHQFSTWHYTNLGDERAKYSNEEITLTHLPIEQKYKIGIGHPYGKVWYENRGVTFSLDFLIEEDETYPDGGVSYETFLCQHMVEMESLSPLLGISPGESAEHCEIWELNKV